jgi:hypothetical protein
VLFERRKEDGWAIADAMSLTREQIEKVYVVALLLENPRRWTIIYLKDDWRRRYERFLLEREERSGLERFKGFYDEAFADEIENERVGLGITQDEQEYVEWEFYKSPGEKMPAERRDAFKEAKESMMRFPTPGRAAAFVAEPSTKALLKRWHREYGQYSGYSHAGFHKMLVAMLPNPKLGLTDSQREQILNTGYLPAVMASYLSTATACAEAANRPLTRKDGSPRPMAGSPPGAEILVDLASLWDTLQKSSLLGQVLWELRVKHLGPALLG